MAWRRWRKQRKHDLLYGAARALLVLWQRLPAPWALRLGATVGRLACRHAGRERRRALAQLEVARIGATGHERRVLVRQMFERLGRGLAQCLLLLRGGETARAQLRPSLTTRARHELAAAQAAGRGIVVVGGHLGNWELVGAALAQVVPLQVLARSSYDPRWSRLIERWRRAVGVGTLWVDRPGALRQALVRLRQGGAVGLLIDQPIRRGGGQVPFFGRPAPTSTVAAALARSTGAALLFAWPLRRGDEDEVEVVAVEGGSRAALDQEGLVRQMAALTALLEQRVRVDPASWLWSLDRWRERD